MAQTEQLLRTLKRTLKAHGRTYADVGAALGLSEASVKRLFSENNLSLRRLDRICQMLDLEISDLVQRMKEENPLVTELTTEQEQEIAGDTTLLLVAMCVLNRWTIGDITRHYRLSETECIRKLVRLDRLRLIELLPGNRVKLLVSPNFTWQENGPIQHFFQQRVEADFFASRFDQQTESLICINGMLSDNANAVFQRKMQRLAREFDELNNDDMSLPLDLRFGTTAVIAIRRWEYGVFRKMRR